MNIGYGVLDNPINKTRTWIPLEIEEFRKRGHTVHEIPRFRERMPDFKEIWQDLDFMVVHSAKRARHLMHIGIPFIVVTHARELWLSNGDVLKHVSKSNNCRAVGYISEYHRQKFIEWGIDKPMVHTPVSIRTELFTRTKPLGNKVLCGARHIEKKGLDLAIKAHPDIWCWGDGPLTPELKQLSDRTHFTGWLSNDALIELMNDGWAYVFPGIQLPDGDMDGQPTTIKEAMAMELQIIATPIAGTAELPYIHFVEPTVEDIKDTLSTVEHTPNIKGRDYVKKRFHSSVFVDNVLEAMA